MEIVCSECGHVGAASEVRPTQAGVALVCANCGHENILDMGASAPAPATPAPAAPATPHQLGIDEIVERARAEKEREQEVWLSDDALERMIPERGEGLRCRKCAAIVASDEDNCPRCGLNYEDGMRHPPGLAPWELPPVGSESAHAQMMLLWERAVEDWGEESAGKFALFARDEGLHDQAIRLLRFYLVDAPDDPIALEHLKDLATRVQSRVIVARAQAEVSAKKFEEGVGRVRWALTAATILFWGAVVLLFFGLYTGAR